MKIGILGAGAIGRTLVQRLAATGHDVKVANSQGPETIDPDVTASGGRAVTTNDAVSDVEVVIMAMPFTSIPEIAPLLRNVPEGVVVIDTSNYYPSRDGKVDAIEEGQVESVWVSELLQRPIARAWNTILAHSFENKSLPVGTPGRIALPVSADRDQDREVAMALVEDTGFDAVHAGSLAESWRQQAGAPCYCTNLTRVELPSALAATERERLPKRRDLMVAVNAERFGDGGSPDTDAGVRIMRALFM